VCLYILYEMLLMRFVVGKYTIFSYFNSFFLYKRIEKHVGFFFHCSIFIMAVVSFSTILFAFVILIKKVNNFFFVPFVIFYCIFVIFWNSIYGFSLFVGINFFFLLCFWNIIDKIISFFNPIIIVIFIFIFLYFIFFQYIKSFFFFNL